MANRYFFHLCTPQGRYDDTDGCEFDSLEAAYLDTHRAIIEISAEMQVNRQDPTGCAFEICSGEGEKLLTVDFEEALRPGAPRPRPHFWALYQRMVHEAERGRGLSAELGVGVARVRENLQALRETIARIGESNVAACPPADPASAPANKRTGRTKNGGADP